MDIAGMVMRLAGKARAEVTEAIREGDDERALRCIGKLEGFLAVISKLEGEDYDFGAHDVVDSMLCIAERRAVARFGISIGP